jgi:putative phosphoesterase
MPDAATRPGHAGALLPKQRRVAVICDVHGNLPALEAALVDLEREAPGLLIVGGDVASGPLPAETIDRLRALGSGRFVRGNADRGIVAAFDGTSLPRWPGPYAAWCAERISQSQRDFLASFEETVAVEIDGLGHVLFCHGSPRSDEEVISPATPLSRLRELLAGTDADVVVCGHTHMQFERTVDRVRVVNPGSVGMPYGTPGAYWALLGPDIELRCSNYDLGAAAERIADLAGADADDFIREHVLTVPSADEALEFFARHGGP